MSRPARFSRGDLIASAVVLAAVDGPGAVTMQGVAAAMGAPSGSVYHRFSGRPELLAEVWVAAVDRFQQDLWSVAEPCHDAGAIAACTVRWAREHRDLACILSLYRAEAFLGDDAPPLLRRRVQAQRTELAARIATLARRFVGSASPEAIERTTFALATVPLAALREPLGSGKPISERLETLVHDAAGALLKRREP